MEIDEIDGHDEHIYMVLNNCSNTANINRGER